MSKKNKISDSELLVKLSAAASYQFSEDRSCPSVLVSTLKNGKIYASIVRYGDFKIVDYSGVKGKLVVCNAVETTLGGALHRLSEKFLHHIKDNKRNPNPVEQLVNFFQKNDSFLDFEFILNDALESSYDDQ